MYYVNTMCRYAISFLLFYFFFFFFFFLFVCLFFFFFFSSRRRHTRSLRDWSSDVCSSDLALGAPADRDLRLPLRGALGDGLPLVVGLLAARQADLDLGTPVLEVERQRRSEERRVGKEGRSRWSACH